MTLSPAISTVPVGERLTAGGEYALFFRDSKYGDPELIDKTQRNPEIRVFVGWTWGRTSGANAGTR